MTPTDEAGAAPDDLQYADPTTGLSGIDPPEPNNSGGAQLNYPLVLPGGRGGLDQVQWRLRSTAVAHHASSPRADQNIDSRTPAARLV